MNKLFKRTIKKLYKTGFFNRFEVERNCLRYRDCYNNLYVIQPYTFAYMFSIGHVEQWIEQKPTFESEYNDLGPVECAAYINHIEPVHTDNSDYILRASLAYILG